MDRGVDNAPGRQPSSESDVQVMPSSPHFWRGRITVAFVFSAPGEEELRQGKPVAGDTGTNLESALSHLHAAEPTLFPSPHRYDYRLTNAWPEPLAASLGHHASEARDSQVRDSENVRRVLHELEGCHLVILSGNKARLLGRSIRGSGRTVIEVPHVGNRGLSGAFETPYSQGLASPSARREHRVQLWARTVLQTITSEVIGGPGSVVGRAPYGFKPVGALEAVPGALIYGSVELPVGKLGMFSIVATRDDAVRVWPAGILRVQASAGG